MSVTTGRSRVARSRRRCSTSRATGKWSTPTGISPADAYGGYNDLYRGDRDPGPVESALCWSHARRKFFELADIKGNVRKGKPAHDISPVALEAVKKIDAIFDIERQINGLDIAIRLDARHRLVRPMVEELHDWMRAEQGTMSKHNPVAKAIAYMFKKNRWDAFTLSLENGRVCLTNDAAERNDNDPLAWLADVLARLPNTTASRVPDLLPWKWQPSERQLAA